MRYTIGIDCPPGNPRPGDFIAQVIEGTGLPERATVSRVFGAWVWDYSDVEDIEAVWEQHSAAMFDRLKALNESGLIRGAEMVPPPASAAQRAIATARMPPQRGKAPGAS